MAEYIDREKLLDELGESASHHAESGREYQLLLRDRNIVREQPTADVIEREKIDKAIEEMTKLLDSTNNIALENRTYDCIEILRRNIGD